MLANSESKVAENRERRDAPREALEYVTAARAASVVTSSGLAK
jgi:hypothetical protein